MLRLHSARESAATEPYSRTPYGWLLRAQLSREAPPPLPGGYKPGEKVGDKLVELLHLLWVALPVTANDRTAWHQQNKGTWNECWVKWKKVIEK